MQEFFTNHYVRLLLLTLILSLLFYIIISLFIGAVGIEGFSNFLRVMISVLGAGLLVYKFFADRVGF